MARCAAKHRPLARTTVRPSQQQWRDRQTSRQTEWNDNKAQSLRTWRNTTITVLRPLSGTTRVSRYQKKHSPTQTYPDHQSFFLYLLPPSTTIHSILSFNLRA